MISYRCIRLHQQPYALVIVCRYAFWGCFVATLIPEILNVRYRFPRISGQCQHYQLYGSHYPRETMTTDPGLPVGCQSPCERSIGQRELENRPRTRPRSTLIACTSTDEEVFAGAYITDDLSGTMVPVSVIGRLSIRRNPFIILRGRAVGREGPLKGARVP
ncbi:hypothetical protein BR93DRAFT_765853 [Coniochaeta sp. PMI_546]|nr:hypothetical protein BR93DRAFT_765853 [Coniochaeta sp. PMI_546]